MLIDALVVDVEQLGEEGQSLIAPSHQRRRKVRRCGGDSVLRGDDPIVRADSHDELLDRAVSVASIASQSVPVPKWS